MDHEAPIVGRERELEAVLDALGAPFAALTILGPAGIGKSCLARQAMRTLRARQDTVFLCDTSEVSGTAGLCDQVAASLGIGAGVADGDDPIANMARAIASRGPLLLVLDNFETQHRDALAVLARWLDVAPELRLLVTSRERLRLEGEQVIELGPLSLPETLPGQDASTQLLCQCVRALQHDWQWSSADAPYIAGILRALDGLPLAIQLAAPRLTIMSPRALLHRLSCGMQALGSKGQGRHGTLDAALEASWLALDAHEQRAMARLAAFRGGFCLEAAEYVLHDVVASGAGALDLLQGLRDKSMLRVFDSPRASGDLRFDSFGPVRAWVERRGEPREMAAGRAAHAAWYASQAERWLREPDAALQIAIERDNLLAVVHRVADHPPVTAATAEPALRSLLALSSSCESHAPAQAWMSILDATLEATRDSGADPTLYARALCLRGAWLRDRGEWQRASRDLLHAVGTARTLCSVGLEAEAVLELSVLLFQRGETTEAAAHAEKAMALWRQCGMLPQEGRAMSTLAGLYWTQGLHEQALPLLERAAQLHASERGDAMLADDCRRLGLLALDLGEHERARDHLTRSMAAAERAGDATSAARAAGWLGLVDHDLGALEHGARAYQDAVAALQDHGDLRGAGLFTSLLGIARREQGADAQAYVLLRQGLAMMGELGDPLIRAVSWLHLHALDRQAGRGNDAESSLQAAHALAASLGNPALAACVRQQETQGTGVDRASARHVHARIAARCAGAARTSAPPPSEDAWVIAPAAEWFRRPHGERVSLERRRPLARLLARLSAQYREAPGHALPWQQVLEAAWPNERVLPAAGAHRVRVAVSTLRKLGLKELLLTVEEGYLLKADCDVVQL